MPTVHLTLCPPPFDPDWSARLVGLRLQIPSHWWPDFDGNDLNAGKIVAVDFSDANQRFFQVKVDGYTYPMRYDAVFNYANTRTAGFRQRYHPHLHRHPVTNPEGELFRIERSRRTHFANANNESESNNETAHTVSLANEMKAVPIAA